ncbi:uncharacterized protein A4U43_UnF6120 [Asparagus officinalis]|uniref:Trichome birefringence-like C-terminal domain-containing protein n=1 Tax=Asparagus officinalis TaxID=4686 RepID=A0A1R3L6I4_ASPOF|nr:uncharacterized protein A4U43_UnF6120 [Asparagus officinalis]
MRLTGIKFRRLFCFWLFGLSLLLLEWSFSDCFPCAAAWALKHVPARVRFVLMLDNMDHANRRWVDVDVLIFNSGHWWTWTKLIDSTMLVVRLACILVSMENSLTLSMSNTVSGDVCDNY